MRWLGGITNSQDMNLSKFPENSEGQGSLACCSQWVHKELDTTEQLNNNKQEGSVPGPASILTLRIGS